jgi:pimeloyl-ACP methyl ester carboxylesterase
VHGWETDHRDLKTISEPLTGLGFLCVLPDLPAHGGSARETMLIPEAAEALVQVGDAHGPFDLCVAHSMGAAVALVAISKGLHAGRVAFLAPPANYVRQLSLSARAAGAPEPLIAAALDVLRSRCAELDGIDSLAMAKHLTMPGLIVVAGRDEVLDPQDGRTLAAAWPASRLLDLPEASHRSVLRDAATIKATAELVH